MADFNYLSVCDGIGAAHEAFKPQGWRCVGASEIEPFPIAVVKARHPEVPHLGDMTKYHEWNIEHPNLICGGTPCQAFSVAGLRAGLADPRGNLALVFLGLVDHFRPEWVVWENVPGVYSATSHEAPDPGLPDLDGDNGPSDGETFVDTYDADEDHAFACFLAGLQELGYGAFGRTLDAQYAGVAQRRRRVFVVGYLGDWRPAAAVLFEPHSLSGDPAPSRRAGERATGTLSARAEGGGGLGTDFECDGGVVAATLSAQPPSRRNAGSDPTPGHLIAPSLRAKHNLALRDEVDTYIAHTLRGEGFDASEDGTGRGVPLVMSTGQANAEVVSDGSPSLTCNHEAPILMRMREGKDGGGKGPLVSEDKSLTLATGNDQVLCASLSLRTREGVVSAELGEPGIANALRGSDGGRAGEGAGAVLNGMQVRRLTPRECERLQSFPDDYTLIPWRGKPADQCPDGPRYKALGNSWCVNEVKKLAHKINIVRQIKAAQPCP